MSGGVGGGRLGRPPIPIVRLDEFSARWPKVFDNRFRLRNLDEDKARLAIFLPAQQFGLSYEDELLGQLGKYSPALHPELVEGGTAPTVWPTWPATSGSGPAAFTGHTLTVWRTVGKIRKLLPPGVAGRLL